MRPQDLKDWVVVPTLKQITKFIPYSEEGVNIVLGTAAQESNFHYLDQTTPGIGPGIGLFQCEKATFNDHWSWLKKPGNEGFYQLVNSYQLVHIDDWNELHGNLYFATIICRLHYYRKPGNLPTALKGMAAYWKKYYNSYLGAGTEAEFIANYKKYVEGLK